MRTWHVLTGEYPPQPGGVSDYTRQLARGLVDAGDHVEVWAPPCEQHDEADIAEPGVEVHRLPDRFGPRSLWRLTRALSRTPPPRILVQYVPHAFGYRGANVAFCLWLRSQRLASVWVMFHEVMFVAEGDRRLSRNVLAAATRLMAWLVTGAAERAFVSIPGWRPMLEPWLAEGADVTWLPVPSAIPVRRNSSAAAAVRLRYSDGGRSLVGHFGTYGGAAGTLLDRTLQHLAALSDCCIVLIGEGSEVFHQSLVFEHPSLAGRVFATGWLPAEEVSHHVAACDVMLQPYPDGISSRRTSAMVALSHGLAIVTTLGRLTEPLWPEARAAVLGPVDDPHALAVSVAAVLFNVSQREEIGRRAAALYDERFDVRHTVAALRALDAASTPLLALS